MSDATLREPVLVMAYDRRKVVEYSKRYPGLIFSYDETIHTETIETTLELRIHSPKMPDIILFNGKEVTLTEV